MSRLLTMTFTTNELLARSSSWLFEVPSYKVTPKGLLSFISRTARHSRVFMTHHHHTPWSTATEGGL